MRGVNEEVVDLFLKAGMDVDRANNQGQTAVMIASEKGYVNLVNKLVTLNTISLNHVDKNGQTALMAAARHGREQCVAALVENGAKVDFLVPSREGAATALQAAVDAADFNESYKSVIAYLLQHGADVKTRNAAGRSPLLFAAEHGRTDAARILVEKGADVNERDLKGNFPLLSAACKGYPWFVAFLAEKGANINMASADGQTPLMCAVQQNYEDTIKVLLEKGAPVNARTTTGASALTDATRMGNVAVVKLLLDHGADPVNGYLPESFSALNGKVLAVNAKKHSINDVLERIAKTAAQDGYRLTIGPAGPNMKQKVTMKAKTSWNKVLREVSIKNQLLLVIKEKEIFILPFDPSAIKQGAL